MHPLTKILIFMSIIFGITYTMFMITHNPTIAIISKTSLLSLIPISAYLIGNFIGSLFDH